MQQDGQQRNSHVTLDLSEMVEGFFMAGREPSIKETRAIVPPTLPASGTPLSLSAVAIWNNRANIAGKSQDKQRGIIVKKSRMCKFL